MRSKYWILLKCQIIILNSERMLSLIERINVLEMLGNVTLYFKNTLLKYLKWTNIE